MKRVNNRVIVGAVLIFVFLLTAGCGVLQEVPTPSAPLEAAPLELNDEEAADEEAAAEEPTEEPAEEPAAEPTEEPAAEPTEEPAEEPAVEPTEEPAAEPTEEPAEESSSGELIIFEISQETSQVRFELDEVLRGDPVTVVGTTDQVAGQIAVNYSDLSQTQVGEIRINARTFVTDNEFRNRAINNEILDSGDFEFITFVPTAVNGLPDSVAIGDSVEFSIVGELTIRDITTEATFDVTAAAVSETEFSGSASTIVTREAYDLTIPEVPGVANVEDDVELYIDFVAIAGS